MHRPTGERREPEASGANGTPPKKAGDPDPDCATTWARWRGRNESGYGQKTRNTCALMNLDCDEW